MVRSIVSTLIGSVTARWVTAIGVTLLLSASGLAWHNYKQSLRDEGIQICNEEIYKANQAVLEDQLAKEKQRARDLEIELQVAREYNKDAERRLISAENAVDTLLNLRKEQEKSDAVYKEWSDAPLPDDVADRVRRAASGSAVPNSD